MAYLPEFEYDVFISYAHEDDEPRGGGWVSRFKRDLTRELRYGLDGSVKIFSDELMSKDDEYRKSLKVTVEKSALFVAVLSRPFLDSDFCDDEWRWFEGKLTTGETSTLLFKAIKFPDRSGEYAQWGPPTTATNFYREAKPPMHFDLADQSDLGLYNGRMAKLADSIASRLEAMKKSKLVFVTQTREKRFGTEFKGLAERLRVLGKSVQPLGKYGNWSDTLAIQKEIEQSEYCLFLVATTANPEIEKLYELAAGLKPKKRCIFVIRTDDSRAMEPRQQEFIEKAQAAGAEFYDATSASRIVELVNSTPRDARPRSRNETEAVAEATKQICIICDSTKEEQTHAVNLILDLQLRAEALKVSPKPLLKPLVPGSAPMRRPSNPDPAIRDCDAVLIYWQNNGNDWLRMNREDLKDAMSMSKAAYRSFVIFDSKPTEQERRDLLRELDVEDRVIGRPAGFDPTVQFEDAKLLKFLKELGFSGPDDSSARSGSTNA